MYRRDIVEKKRKVFEKIKNLLISDSPPIIFLQGIRKVGKTTILRQIEQELDGYYVDFREAGKEAFFEAVNSEKKIILLDEIGYLPNFNSLLRDTEKQMLDGGKRWVITSSSYDTLTRLSREDLGGGRSTPIVLFPLSFEEHLYFSGKIDFYGQDYTPKKQDLKDFYDMSNLPNEGLRLFIDKDYMDTVFHDASVARANISYTRPGETLLSSNQFSAVLDLLAYNIDEGSPTRAVREKNLDVGNREFPNIGIDCAGSILYGVKVLLATMQAKEIARILHYLLMNGFLFVEVVIDSETLPDADSILSRLEKASSDEDLTGILTDFSLNVISPLLYTRLRHDLENTMGRGSNYDNWKGNLYELTVKTESIFQWFQRNKYKSYKFHQVGLEETQAVDLYLAPTPSRKGLLLECSVANKSESDYWVHKVFPARNDLVRIVTSAGKTEMKGEGIVYFKMNHMEAVHKMSNGTILDIEVD